MNLNFYIAKRISKKSAGGGKLSSVSSVIATVSVALSIAIMIVAIAVANGFRDEIREKTSGFGGDITLQAPGVDITNHLYPIKSISFEDTISSLEFVKSLQPVSYRTGVLKSDSLIQGVIFKGIDGNYNMEFFSRHLCDGTLPDYSLKSDSTGYILPPSNDILISRRLANIMGYKVGDKSLAYFVDEDVRVRRFRVCGIYDAQLDQLDQSLVVADMRHISHLNGWKNGEINGYELLLHKKYRDRSRECSQVLDDILYRCTSDEDASIVPTTIQERFYILFDWLHLLDLNVLIILVLMIAVAGFNMVSGLLIILFERISQIGLFKAMGMRNSNISRIFLNVASSIVIKGLVAGNLIALVLCWVEKNYKVIPLDPSNYFVNYVPVSITPVAIAVINLVAFSAIMVILLVPCRLISKISPARTLKIE